MAEFGFEMIENNFPPDPAPIIEQNGDLVCDLTCYDPPTTFPSNVFSETNLKVLKVFTDHIRCIPKGLGKLRKLEQLLLSHYESHPHKNSTELPENLKNLVQLKSVDLRYNPLCNFPTQLLSLVSLTELNINNCDLSCLPNNFTSLQSLEVLDLSGNSFKHIPLCVTMLPNLKRLYMSNTGLETVHESIGNLKILERLNLEKNRLTSVPDELFNLGCLKKLQLSYNEITSISDKVDNLVSLEYLLLNQNKLTKLPDTIGNLQHLHYLNLHENLLTRLPEGIGKLQNMESLLVDSNPLQVPPVNVCNRGTGHIANYFNAMKNTGGIHSKRLKVVLLGESLAGKTSLVEALVKGEACEINLDDRTFGVGFYHWMPEPDVDELELLVVDCAGQRKYQMTHRLFLSEGALFLLVVNLHQYKFDDPDYFYQSVGHWVELVAAKIPKARIVIVPTNVDHCMNQEEVDLKCKNILNFIVEEQKEMSRRIDAKMKYIENIQGICIPEEDKNKLLEEQMEKKNNLPVISLHYKEVIDQQPEHLRMHVVPVSNVGQLQGMMDLRKELVRIARDRNLVPTVDAKLPISWVSLGTKIKEVRKDMKVPCITIDELQELLWPHEDIGQIPVQSDLRSCLLYLHGIGELIYFQDIPHLVKNIVLNPCWFGSILKQVFRHDLESQLVYKESYRLSGVHSFQLQQDKQQLFTNGIMTKNLLKCIWHDCIEPTDDIIFSELLVMFTHFGLACEIQVATCSELMNEHEDPVCYLMPWFVSSDKPSLEGKWPYLAPRNQIEVTVGYSVLQYLPLGCFERFSVRCYSFDPQECELWQDGLYMRFGDVHVLGSVQNSQKCSIVKVSARAPCGQLSMLWNKLLLLLKEVRKLLNEWPCMNYVDFTVCPECVKQGAPEPYMFGCNWSRTPQLNKQEARCKNKVNGQTHQVKLKYLFPPNTDSKSEDPPFQDSVLPDDCLDYIAEGIGTRWPELARKVGMDKKVDSLKEDNRDNTREQAVKMLNLWRQKLGREAKVNVIVDKLKELDLTNIAEGLHGWHDHE